MLLQATISIVNMYVKIYRLSIRYVMGNVEDPQALHQDTIAGSRISLIERMIEAKTNGGIIAQFSFLLTVCLSRPWTEQDCWANSGGRQWWLTKWKHTEQNQKGRMPISHRIRQMETREYGGRTESRTDGWAVYRNSAIEVGQRQAGSATGNQSEVDNRAESE